MNDTQKLIIDYIEGRVSPAIFEDLLETDASTYDWLQNLVPEGMLISKYDHKLGQCVSTQYTIQEMCQQYEALDQGGPKGSVAYHFYVHNEISKLFMNAFPDLCVKPDKSLEQNYDLSLDICPDYIGGTEVAESNIIGQILNAIPTDWTKTNRMKEAKKRIKETFHIEGKTYPRWIQAPEWPVFDGRPMKFLRTEKLNPESKVHYFIDVQTGHERSVEDSF